MSTRKKAVLLSLLVFLVAVVLSAPTGRINNYLGVNIDFIPPVQAQTFVTKNAEVGESATGTILMMSKNGKTIAVNIRPCAAQNNIKTIVFRNKFIKIKLKKRRPCPDGRKEVLYYLEQL